MAKRNITPNDLKAAENLRKIWGSFKEKHDLSQERAGALIGMTQSAFGQYLRGEIPLNTDATIKFARLLGVHPTDLRKDLNLDFKSNISNAIVITSPEEIELITSFRSTPEQGKVLFKNAIDVAKDIYLTRALKRKKHE